MPKVKWVLVGVASWTAGAALAISACGTDSHDGEAGDAAADHAVALDDAAADAGAAPNGDGSSPGIVPIDGCTPLTACPAGVTCGRYTDPCSGVTFACGSSCDGGQVCTTDPNNPAAQSCQPKTCAGHCGVAGYDSCGVAINCGGCDGGRSCVSGACVAAVDSGPAEAGACPTLTCTPDPSTALCGTITDGCGHTKSCSCAANQLCLGGQCVDVPPECGDEDAGTGVCGSVTNACGSGTIACPTKCGGDTSCVKGACTACTPPTCGARTCGSVSNGCGPSVSCGNCGNSESCYDGGCCTPETCAEAIDAGQVSGCAAVDLGCGVKQACVKCGAGQICTNNTCVACTPKTCADFGNAGCGHSDGCGGTLNCCGPDLTCTSGLCCGEGQVAYNGSCCAPSCDPSQPPGPQDSCGQVIFCTGTGGGPR